LAASSDTKVRSGVIVSQTVAFAAQQFQSLHQFDEDPDEEGAPK
jgi:hypothetical protein